MKRIFTHTHFSLATAFSLAFLLAVSPKLSGQSLNLLHTVTFPFVTNGFGDVGSSDCWGWTDQAGVDYAIIGNVDNVAFVRASDGAILDQVQAASSFDPYYHRDMVTHGNYCYVVAEMGGVNDGLQIIDLSYLPDSVHFVKSWDNNGQMERSHNIDIDSGSGHLYIEGDGNGGIDIVSIQDPENPVKVGFIPVPGVHDMHARNDTLWVAEGSVPAFSIYDVTDKGNPSLLGRVQDPSFGYCHNIWPSDDGRFFFTTEETSFKSVKVWDASNMANLVKRGEYLAPNNLAHNVHVMGKYLFISHYTSGVTIVDWSNPDVPVEVAAYDTYPQHDISDFFGCWGTYPYTNNGYVYASNFEGKLFILEWDETVSTEAPIADEPGLAYPNPFTSVTNIPFTLGPSLRALRNGHVIDEEARRASAGDEFKLKEYFLSRGWQGDR
ncbi:MAG: choice-of-anchor B family protein, partial [Bacteroidota bacterium]